MKEQDIILNMLANPSFTVTDFQSVGLYGENTGLRSESEYLNSEKITSNVNFQDSEGNFDKAKFHNFYNLAGQFYNQLVSQDYEKAALEQFKYSVDNWTVDKEKRTEDFAPKLVRVPNEHLVTSSLDAIGIRGQRKYSQSEIAQTRPVYDPKTGEWGDSPNDGFFDYFGDTLVLAEYDEDEYDNNGNLIHQKGERKLDDEGLPYYEKLAGRDVYNKKVLSKLNMLTTDGSLANRYDFFDTDGIEQKSIGSSVLRNTALVGSMFIPWGVGAAITGLSVAVQLTGLLGSLSKLIASNDNETLNNIVGWTKTVNRQGQTEYATRNTWCGENIINMIGDVVGQLREQRWIFEKAPLLIGRNQAYKAMSGDKGYNKVIDDITEELSQKGANLTVSDLLKGATAQNLVELGAIQKAMAAVNKTKAAKIVEEMIESANKAGAPLSMAYMTGLVVQDTYSEVLAAGASHTEAALLTLGYAAAEMALLNSNVGKWILPELKSKEMRFGAIYNSLTDDIKNAYKVYNQTGSKETFVKKMLGLGAKAAKQANTGKKTAQMVGTHAAFEALEETSEEVLADLAKSTLNISRWLRGEEGLELGEWDNVADRYLMSALGGFVGGGISSAATDFKEARSLASMDKSKAMQELLYMVNNNKEGEFLKWMDEQTFGNEHLSSKIIGYDEARNPIYAEGTKEDNQDKEIKSVIKNKIASVKAILESEGAKISTQSLLNKLTLEQQKDLRRHLRYINLQNATSMGLYLQDYQNIQAELVSLNDQISSIRKDHNTPEEEKLIAKLEAKVKEQQIKKDAYLTGQIAPDAIKVALFEMNPYLSDAFLKTNVKRWIENKSGKKWNELSKEELDRYIKQYKDYSKTEMKNDLKARADEYQNMLELFSLQANTIQEFTQNLLSTEGQAYRNLANFVEQMTSYTPDYFKDEEEFIVTMSQYLQAEELESARALGKGFLDEGVYTKLDAILKDETKSGPEKQTLYITELFTNLNSVLDGRIAEFEKIKYIHPEVKKYLKRILKMTEDGLSLALNNLANTMGDPQQIAFYMQESANIQNLIDRIDALDNTPIMEYLNKFQINVLNSDLNLQKHLDSTDELLLQAKENNNLDELVLEEQWLEDNEEAIKLIDSFIAVVNGMRVDNADLINPTGYSKMLNEVYTSAHIKDYVKLTELDSSVADIIVQDAMIIKNRLEFAKNVHQLNAGQILRQQPKVAANTNYLIYNTLKNRLFNILPEDWISDEEGVSARQKLENLSAKSEVLNNLSQDNLNLEPAKREQMQLEMIQIRDALYDIFQLNKADEESIGKLISKFAADGGYFQKTGNVLDASSKVIDDHAFIYWLASTAALRASDFYKAYHEAIQEKIAPIPSQELGVYLATAGIANMDMINKFTRAYKKEMMQMFNTLNPEKRKEYLKNFDGAVLFADKFLKYFGSYDAVPQFENMIFIEGIAGSGKTSGIWSTVRAIIDNIDPEVLKGSIFAHVTKKNAENANENIKLDSPQFFDKEGLMKYISPEWKDTTKNPKNKDNKNYLYEDSYEFDKNGALQNKWKINHYTKVPRVIFIDEITHYNQHELRMIEQFAKEHGIVVISAGDLDQNSLAAYFKEGNEDMSVGISRNYFPRVPKLGLTLRTLNRQMNHSVLSMQASLRTVQDGKSVNIKLSYLDNDKEHKGLFGVKAVSRLKVDDIKADIDNIFATATNKVGYIYHSEDTPIYKYIMENYSDKVERFKDSEAQGKEGQYYIVENAIPESVGEGSSADIAYLKSLYTGITRAKQGALAIISDNTVGQIESITSNKDSVYQIHRLGEVAIRKEAERRRKELGNIMSKLSPNSIKIIAPTITSTTSTEPPVTIPPAPIVVKKTREGDSYYSKEEADRVLNEFGSRVIGDITVRNNITNEEVEIIDTKVKEADFNGTTVYTPIVVLSDGTLVSVDAFNKNYTIYENNKPIQLYNIGDKLIVNGSPILIQSVDENLDYLVTNLDGTNDRVISQEDLQKQFQGYYVEPIEDVSEDLPETGFENSPSSYEAVITEENSEEETKTPGISHKLYTFDTFDMGITLKDGKIEFEGRKEERIDNAIGLMNLLGYNPSNWGVNTEEELYYRLEQEIANLTNRFRHTPDNSELANRLKRTLGLKGNVSIIYAIKSTAGENDNANYGKYYQDENAETKYIQSDDPEVKLALRKKLVVLVKNDNDVVFELSLGGLNSPLTLMQERNEEGNLIYPEVHDIYMESIERGDDQHTAINNVINQLDGNTNEQDLVNLFKFWEFTSNGIFYFGEFNKAGEFKPSDFNLASNSSTGVQLVKSRGNKQLNGKLQFDAKFINISEFAKNPEFTISSLMSVRNAIHGLNPGHTFVLVTTDPNIKSDEDLVREYKAGNPNVSKFYVTPPQATVTDWAMLQQQLKVNPEAKNTEPLIGNNFTAYYILRAIKDSGIKSGLDSAKAQIFKAVEDLQEIEEKWKQESIPFDGSIISNGKTDQELYEEYKTKYSSYPKVEQMARQYIMQQEMLNYMSQVNDWGNLDVGASATIQQAMASYITEILYDKVIDPLGGVTFVEHLDRINELNNAATRGGFGKIFFRAKFSEDAVGGDFIKVVTQGGKYSLFDRRGNALEFQINAKIISPTYIIPSLSKEIAKFTARPKNSKGWERKTKYYYFNGKTWVLTSLAKPMEEDYLGTKPMKSNQLDIISEIKREYGEWFNKGVLNEALLDPNLDKEANLINLATEYNKKKGQWGFVHNKSLYLTTFDSDIELVSPTTNIGSNLRGIDSKGVEYIFEPLITYDGTNVTKVEMTMTTLTPVSSSTNPFQNISENHYVELLNSIQEWNKAQKTPFAKILTFLVGSEKVQGISSLLELIEKLTSAYVTTGDYMINGVSVKKASLISQINQTLKKKEFSQHKSILEAMLNLINQVGGLNINQYNILKNSTGRYLVTFVGADSVTAIPLNSDEYYSGNISDYTNREQVTIDSFTGNKIEETICKPTIWKLTPKL